MGCSFSAVADPADGAPETSGTRAALVTIERASDGHDSTKADVVARVVRVQGPGWLDEASLRLAGFGDDWPALGTCTASPARPSVAGVGALGALGKGSLELLDLGQVAIELADGTRTALVARHVPDPAGVLSGIVYNARIADPSALASRTGDVHASDTRASDTRASDESRVVRLAVRAVGVPQDPESVAFVAQITPPKDVSDLRIAGQDPKDFSAPTGSLEVTWSPLTDSRATDEKRPDLEDVVAFEVRGADASRSLVRCAFPDGGRAIVPFVADEGTVVVHRVRRERFHLDGHKTGKRERERERDGEGEIRFDSSRSFAYGRSSRTVGAPASPGASSPGASSPGASSPGAGSPGASSPRTERSNRP